MRVPQVTDRLKEAPAQALRAVFSGVGQVLLVADRLRHRPGQDGIHPAPPPPGPGSTVTPVSTVIPGSTVTSRSTVTPGTPGTLDGPPVDFAADERAEDLPLAGYDGLTVPQLRARMQKLDPAQLRALIAHERAHAGRDHVVAMFERRIARVESGG
jgi:hypothetical protein